MIVEGRRRMGQKRRRRELNGRGMLEEGEGNERVLILSDLSSCGALPS